MRALEILHSEGSDSIVLADTVTHDDIAEVFHNERHTVNQTVEQALVTARLFAAAPALLEALKTADAAINEMFRYFDGGETRGSYDGKPERAQLRKAGYSARAAIAKATGAA